eukprot:GHVT01081537.1.p3 GENE.GHVT01081537.1~~GHVT01081537.1.p3  ORF type:complete len:108 (-),score=19.21 GHVT01081537.1:1111-1434(-)
MEVQSAHFIQKLPIQFLHLCVSERTQRNRPLRWLESSPSPPIAGADRHGRRTLLRTSIRSRQPLPSFRRRCGVAANDGRAWMAAAPSHVLLLLLLLLLLFAFEVLPS